MSFLPNDDVVDLKIKVAPGARLFGAAQPEPTAHEVVRGKSLLDADSSFAAVAAERPLAAAAAAAARPLAAAAAAAPPALQHGVPREALAVTYVTTTGPQPDVPLDALLFEAPRDRGKTFYFARYRLATQNGDYMAKLRRDGTDWVLDIPLERYPAETLAARVSTATPVDAIVRVTLVYGVDLEEGTLQKSLEFQSVSVRNDGIVASLRVSAPPDQDELYEALRSRSSQARLTVWREEKVGVPMQLATDELARLTDEMRALRLAPLVWMRTSMGGYLSADGSRAQDERNTFVLENLSGHDQLQSGDTVRLRAPGGTTCLAGVGGGPMKLVQVQNPPPPEQQMLIRKKTGEYREKPVFAAGGPIKMGDTLGISFFRLRDNSYMSQPQWDWALESPPPDDPGWARKQEDIVRKRAQIDALQRQFSTTQFDATNASLPLQVAPVPFFIRETNHPNFYNVKPNGTGGGGLQRIQVDTRVYYQDLAQRQRFYYLPDRFELRVADGQRFPDVRIRATPDVNTYLVEYAASPVVDGNRLRSDAAARLLQEANRLSPTPFALTNLELEPLLGDQTSLSLEVPGAGGWKSQARPNTVTDLFHAFTDVLTLDAEGLRQLCDALFNTTTTPFRGTVAVSLGVPNIWARHEVPFVGRVSGPSDAFWEAAFNPSVPARFMRRIDVVADNFPFGGSSSVAVAFEFGGVVVLSQTQNRGFTDVGQPIAEYVLRAADAGSYRYRLSPIGGAPVCGDWRIGQGSTLRLTSW